MSIDRKKKSLKIPSPAEQIRASLTEILRSIETGDRSRLTVREVEIPDPRPYSARTIKALRRRLAVSQRIFADLVGVSPELVEHWEQGRREPARVVRRLLDQISADPQAFLGSLVRHRTVA
jgi:DNA-binding transcriptional regulator YiaG